MVLLLLLLLLLLLPNYYYYYYCAYFLSSFPRESCSVALNRRKYKNYKTHAYKTLKTAGVSAVWSVALHPWTESMNIQTDREAKRPKPLVCHLAGQRG